MNQFWRTRMALGILFPMIVLMIKGVVSQMDMRMEFRNSLGSFWARRLTHQ